MGVSIGISKELGPHARVSATHPVATPASKRLRLFFGAAGPIIDFLEQLVVLTNLGVVRLELNRFFVGLSRFIELSFVLVRYRQIVISGGIRGVDLDGPFPPVDRLAPQT